MTRHGPRGLLVVALVAAVVGAGRARDEVTATGPALPFDAFRFTVAEEAQVGRALERLATACMRERGFAAFRWDAPRPRADVLVVDNSRRYGVISAPAVARFGYHKPPTAAEAETRALLDWLGRLPPRVHRALAGENGCRVHAGLVLLRGVPDNGIGWFTRLDFASLDRSEADPRVTAALAAWSRCMASLGYDFADVWAPPADPRVVLGSSHPSATERRLAGDDVGCKRRTRLVETWIAVESEWQRATIAARQPDFAALCLAKVVYLDNARRVIGAGHGEAVGCTT